MPSPRTVPSIAQQPQANEISLDNFFRIDIASPVGTKRFTNRGADVSANIDGTGTQTWSSIEDLVFGPISQTETDPLSVSWVRFFNLDLTWTTWAQSPGLRGAAVQLWRGWFDPVAGTFSGAFITYKGEVDNQEHGESSMLALKPFGTSWGRQGPFLSLEQIDQPFFATLMPPRDKQIALGGGFVVQQVGPKYNFVDADRWRK